MRESEKQFLKGLDSQLHNDFISEEEYTKLAERMNLERQWEHDRLERQAQEETRRKMYQQGEMPSSDRSKFEEGMREFVKTISADIEAQKKKEAAELAKIEQYSITQKEVEPVDSLLEMAERKLETINTQIAAAEAEGDEALLGQYTRDKEMCEKEINLYRAKYNLLTSND